jgi:hypothetical protein
MAFDCHVMGEQSPSLPFEHAIRDDPAGPGTTTQVRMLSQQLVG